MFWWVHIAAKTWVCNLGSWIWLPRTVQHWISPWVYGRLPSWKTNISADRTIKPPILWIDWSKKCFVNQYSIREVCLVYVWSKVSKRSSIHKTMELSPKIPTWLMNHRDKQYRHEQPSVKPFPPTHCTFHLAPSGQSLQSPYSEGESLTPIPPPPLAINYSQPTLHQSENRY